MQVPDRWVDSGELRLPRSRQSGPDFLRYQSQVSSFGAAQTGMPPIQVTQGAHGLLKINDGVTRAVRIHRLAPGSLVPIEVIDFRPRADYSRLKKVSDIR
jgi:hypothetical protein